MKQERLQEIIVEELVDVLIENITRRFSKAVEAYQKIQLQQQQLRKKFVDEKDPKKKEALKQSLITLHKKVQKAESDFNSALKSEPIEDDLMEKSKGLWANIHAKRKRGEKPARKGSKAFKKAKKAARDINEAGQYKDVSDKFKDALDNLPDKKFTMKNISDLIKKTKQKRPDSAMAYAKDAFGWIGGGKWLKEGKLNEDVFKSFLGDDPAFKLYTATNTDKRKSVQARKTDKTWDDGVPVLKYIARAPKKDSPLPKGKFKIIEDNKHGWWYYQVGNTWYGISQKDYGTPPFEY